MDLMILLSFGMSAMQSLCFEKKKREEKALRSLTQVILTAS